MKREEDRLNPVHEFPTAAITRALADHGDGCHHRYALGRRSQFPRWFDAIHRGAAAELSECDSETAISALHTAVHCAHDGSGSDLDQCLVVLTGR